MVGSIESTVRFTRVQRKVVCHSIAAIGALLLLGGCGMERFVEDKVLDAKSAVGSESYVDRCGDFVQKANPAVDIEITNGYFTPGQSIDLATVDIEGTEIQEAGGQKTTHDIAAQCHFKNGVITDFHWTKSPEG